MNAAEHATDVLEQLNEMLSYDAATGEFRWKKRPSNFTKHAARVGTITAEGYIRIKLGAHNYMAHRLAWLVTHGDWPRQQIDHINGDKADNRIANLRDVSAQINKQNMRSARADSTTGVLGVTPIGRKFAATLNVGGKNKCLGYFSTVLEAQEAYVQAKRIHHVGATL